MCSPPAINTWTRTSSSAKDSLIREFAGMPAGTAVDGRAMAEPYYHLNYDFGLKADSQTRRAGERAA
jgi:hypothetical protein